MVSKVKKIVGGVIIVFVVLALIGACFGEDDEMANFQTEYEKRNFTSISNHLALKKACESGDKRACEKLDFVNNLFDKCFVSNESKACMQLVTMADKKQISETDWLLSDDFKPMYDLNGRKHKFGSYEDSFRMDYAFRIDSSTKYLIAILLMKGCDLNNADACYRGVKHSRTTVQLDHRLFTLVGCVELKDANTCFAADLCVNACELGEAAGCNNAGVAYEYPKDKVVELDSEGNSNKILKRDFVTAKKYYDKACKMGSEKGCENAKRIAKERGL